ncbi:sensor histidine kinase [Enterobacterales bacterium CwR94]|nr:sensor histidine kinase [Enterobacterales bacterium CwR94]
MKKSLLLAICLLISPLLHATDWHIGVLLMRGEAQTRDQWQPLVDALNQALPGERFYLMPLDLDGMREAVTQQRIQFVLTNPAQFVRLNGNHYLRWLASLRSSKDARGTHHSTGSAILVRADSTVRQPKDLIGSTIGAVDPLAFGGYMLGYKYLNEAGIRPGKDLQIHFSGFPADALIYLLRASAVQAAIVPVCLLESMDKEGLIDKREFRALPGPDATQPCLSSTPLYPDWSFGALAGVSDEITDAVARTLINASTKDIFRWGAPASSKDVDALLREFNQHPEQQRLGLSVRNWLIQNRYMLTALITLLLLAVGNYVWVMILVKRRGLSLERANETLLAQQQALEQASRMSILGEMASGFAHELNQPLSAIRMYAQGSLMRLPPLPEHREVREAIAHIDSQAARGGNIINNLRDWASGPNVAPQATLHWRAVSVVDTLEHVWEMLRISKHYPETQLVISGEADPQLVLPPVLLEQVLANLVLNAVQAGARVIEVTLQCESDSITVRIKDDAGGIAPQRLVEMFTPFTGLRPGGMGLGLAISQRLLRSVGGEIKLDNYLLTGDRKGLMVTLTLPLQPEVIT